MSKSRSNIILRISSLLTLGSNARTKLKTFARLSEALKELTTIKTDRGK